MTSDAALSGRGADAKSAAVARGIVVGDHPGLDPDSLRSELELRRGSIDDARVAVTANAVDVILLDGLLPAEALSRVLELAEDLGEKDRPVVVVLAHEGRRTNVESHLIGHPDDFVNAFRGSEALLARVRRALRTRAGLRELARKNAELEALYGRLEGLAGRMGEELRLAAHLQRSLLPPALQHSRLDVAREFLPFREIGGDYYDLIPLGPERIAFAIGDVMGKGVPAALLAANLKACLRAQLQAGEVSPGHLVGRVNRLFWEVTPKGLFASLVFALFDFAEETLHYVNAGHDYPFVVRADGALQDLVEGGTVLGLIEDSAYQQGSVRLERGDSVVFYSDGVTDRSNVRDEAYGSERLKEAAVRTRGDRARLALYSLLGEVQGWAGGAAAEDDMTLVVAKIL
jgi:sigma-B regulation protein RsbU (phosphoserine phosphatase)